MISVDKYMVNNENIIDFGDENNKFSIYMAACDLYWVLDEYYEDNKFIITKDDEYWFFFFNLLFDKIKKIDDKYMPTIKDNIFEWISEAEGIPEVSHKLKITKYDDKFMINFIRNPQRPSKMCAICFCNSGSRYSEIVKLFMIMFLRLSEIGDKYNKVSYKKILSLNPLNNR